MAGERIIPLAREQLDPFVRRVQVNAFFELLRTGEPVPIERLPEVRAVVDGLVERGRMTTTGEGITGSLGLTVRETPHRLELAEGVRHTWCALDAVGILPALDRTGFVVSAVPGTTENVRIEFDTGRVRAAPSGLALLVPGAPTGPVVLTWCPLANFFPSEEQARIWADRHGIEGYTVIDLPEAIDQAAPLWRAVLTDNPGEGQ